jgi:hypothetical protein
MSNYHYVDVVKAAIDAGHARVPPLQESAIREFGDIVSYEVQHNDWTIIEGKPLHKSGKGLEDYLDFCILTRAHWLIPEVVVEATEMWLNPTLTAQGKRWREINAVLGDKDATNEALAKEAAKYGCTVGSITPGVKPGTKPAGGNTNRDNPYAPAARGYEEDRMKKILKHLASAPASLSASLARSAKPPCKIDGSPL